MSSANVDLVRSSFEAFGRGDFDEAFAVYAPDVEWQTADDEPDSRTYTGIPALRRFAAHLSDPWSDRFGPAVSFGDVICDGCIRRVDEYRTVEEALEAVGPAVT